MRATLWGTRGSIAAPGPETVKYGGNTSCVEVRADDGSVLVLDAGTGIRRLGGSVNGSLNRVDLLLTHLHMDHIQGLGFFAPLFRPDMEVHIWGPHSTTLDLKTRLQRYLSPPLFPVYLRELPCQLQLHNAVSEGKFEIGPFSVSAGLVCHPGPTVGYRVEADGRTLAYLPDHEPALCTNGFPTDLDWLSGGDLCADVDLLIHDAQYSEHEYPTHVGWGHSGVDDTVQFSDTVGASKLVLFHHDPARTDAAIDQLKERAQSLANRHLTVDAGAEGQSYRV